MTLAVASLSIGVALIHASVMVAHFREYWLFGLFFALVAPLQFLFAYLVIRPAVSREVLVIGAIANVSVALVWLISRTSGLPFGPETWEAETVHAPDVIATLDELAIAALVVLMLRSGTSETARRWGLGVAWSLAAASLIGAMLGASGPH